jgi:hypothetical protein
MSELCDSMHEGYVCVKPMGHDGLHQAGLTTPHLVKITWGRTYTQSEVDAIVAEKLAGMRAQFALHVPCLHQNWNLAACECGWQTNEGETSIIAWQEHVRQLPDSAAGQLERAAGEGEK